jgi:hypothetical protein
VRGRCMAGRSSAGSGLLGMILMEDAPILAFALAVLVAFVWVLVWSMWRIRRGGGGATVGVLGATHEMLSSDQRKAAEEIIHRNAAESREDESSSDPANKE